MKRVCPVTKLNFCKCGCGSVVKHGKIYAAGHRNRVLWSGKTYKQIYGERKANEIRAKIAKTSRERYNGNPIIRDILRQGRAIGRRVQPDAIREWWQDSNNRKQWSASRRIFLDSELGEEYRQNVSRKVSISKKAAWADKSHTYNTVAFRQKLSEGRQKQWRDNSALRKLHSDVLKAFWQSPEKVKRWMKANNRRPNSKEMKLSYILRQCCPHQFRYNGDGRLGIIYGTRIPDFVNTAGKPLVVEHLGEWWHSERMRGLSHEDEEQRLISHYAQFGYKCLIVWESELRHLPELKQKLRECCPC